MGAAATVAEGALAAGVARDLAWATSEVADIPASGPAEPRWDPGLDGVVARQRGLDGPDGAVIRPGPATGVVAGTALESGCRAGRPS